MMIVHSKEEDVYIKCTKCNKLMYFDCDEIKEVKKHLENHHNMVLDFNKSNMIGKCTDCKIKEDKNK